MAPLNTLLEFSTQSNYFWGFIIGIFFGIFLEQGGFGNARKLALTFYLRDMTVVKVMFTAIITAMTGVIILTKLNLLNMDHVWINPSYITPGIVGGLIMGFGFVIGGYCPGTALVGVATYKIDAMINILGAMTGMLFFAEVVPFFQNFYNSGFVGDRLLLPEALGLPAGVVAFLVILIALLAFVGSEYAEKYLGEKE